MTVANRRDQILYTIRNYEGGFDNDRRDRGNWTSGKIGVGELKGTKYGIAAFVYPNLDIRNLTEDQAVSIYEQDYWPKVDGDNLPAGPDVVAYDGCVNSGAGRSLQWLGQALGSPSRSAPVLSGLARAAADKVALVKAMCAARRGFLISLHNAVYERGWLKRVANIEARGVRLALADGGRDVVAGLKAESTKATAAARTNATGAISAPTVTTASQTVGPPVDLSMPVKVILVTIVLAITLALVIKAYQHFARARAFSNEVTP